jgi:hypothetical protein
VWKLKVLGKIQIFVWRALHGAIPGRAALAYMHMKVNASCPICHGRAEDILHILFKCSRARDVWKALGLNAYIDQCCEGE